MVKFSFGKLFLLLLLIFGLFVFSSLAFDSFRENIQHDIVLNEGGSLEVGKTSTVYLEFPKNNQPVGGTNNTIPFVFNHTGALIGDVNCTVFIDNIAVSYVEFVPANQKIEVFSNSSISFGTHSWNVSCFNGTHWDNSTTFSFNLISCEFGSWDDVCKINATKNVTSGFINTTGDIEILDKGELTTSAGNGTTFVIYARSLTIYPGGKITGNVNITSTNLTIYPNAKIDVSAKGYGASSGPGKGGDAASTADYYGAGGGGYGGNGGNGYGSSGSGSGGLPYGSLTQPTDLGSGGGNAQETDVGGAIAYGGAGGGAIFLNITDTLIVNGSISANGGNGGINTASGQLGAGGGSGGSIWIIATNLVGNGSISANGGNGGIAGTSGQGGGGSGGRIAIYYNTADLSSLTISVNGGSGYQYGEPGTISLNGDVIPGFCDWKLSNSTHCYVTGTHYLNTNHTYDFVYLNITGSLNGYSINLSFPSLQNLYVNGTLSLGIGSNLTIPNASLIEIRGTLSSGRINISATNLTIYPNAKIDVSAKGFAGGGSQGAGSGPGKGIYGSGYAGSGAGYGGRGGNDAQGDAGGSPYGSPTEPTDFGSGGGGSYSGPGGAGGGAIKLNVSGTLTINGSIIANGDNGLANATGYANRDGGGGSGGSIWIIAETLIGNGTITANGGSGDDYGGGGSGGRIAIYYEINQSTVSILANGGSGYQAGQKGSIYLSSLATSTNLNATIVNQEQPLKVYGKTAWCGNLTNETLTNYWVCSDFLLPNEDVSIWLDDINIVNVTSNSSADYEYSFNAPSSLGIHKVEARLIRSGLGQITYFEVRNLTFSEFNLLDEHGQRDSILNQGEAYNLTLKIQEFNGTSYFDVTSGSFELTIEGITYSLLHIGSSIWKTNQTVGNAPLELGTYSFLANITGSSANGIIGSVMNANYTFYVKKINVTLNLNDTVANPNQLIEISGKAILLPDNLNVSNNPISIWLNEKLLPFCEGNNPPCILNPGGYVPALGGIWKYRKPITINNTLNSNHLTDYQVLVTLDTASLISQGKMRSDCGDIRFTDSDGNTLLNYWIESGCNSTNTKIWIKVPLIPASSNKTIYLYYGNPSAISLSNPTDTLDIYADFQDGTLQGWSDAERDTGNPGCVNDYPAATVDSTTGNPSPSAKKGPEQGSGYGCEVGISKTINLPGNVNISIKVDNRAYSTYSGSTVTNAYIAVYQGNSITGTLLWNQTLVAGGTTDTGWISYGPYIAPTTGQTTVTIFLYTVDGWTADYDKTVWFDNIIVRKYVSPEPATSIGNEEITLTDSYGDYNYTFIAPLEAGTYSIKVNLTNENGIYGENETQFINRIAIREQKAVSVKTKVTNYLDVDDELINISAKVYKNIDNPIDKVWVDITLPNNTVKTYYLDNTTLTTETQIWYKVLNVSLEFNNLLGEYLVTFYANSTLKDGSTITQEIPAPTTKFYVQNISVSVNLNSTIANPNQLIEISGKAILLPDNLNVSNNPISIWLNEKLLGLGLRPDGILRESCWLQGWKYRKPITINNTLNSNNLTDYQVLVTLDTQSLISAGKMRSDCGDIRFTDSDETTLLNYWIESGCNSTNTKIWIKVPLIPASSNKTIYLYYGNPSAISLSNKDNVFPLYDFYPNYPNWSDNRTSMCGNQGMMGGYNNFGSGASTQKTINLDAGTYNISFIFIKGDSWDGEYGRLYINGNLVWQKSYSGEGSQICGSTNSGWNELFDFISVTFNHPGGTLTIKFNSTLNQAANDEWWGVDRIMIRKYTSPEPTTSIGNEEPATLTDSYGDYNYTFFAPLEFGDYIIKVNLTNEQGIYGENETILKVRDGNIVLTRNYSIQPNFTENSSCSIYYIKIGDYLNATDNQPVFGNFSVRIDNIYKECFSLKDCTFIFSVGGHTNCEIKPGNKTIFIRVENETSYYWPYDDTLNYYLEDLTTSATILAYNLTVYNVSLTEDKIEQFNITINNTGKATIHAILITKYSGPFPVINTTPIPDVLPEQAINITFNITIPAGTSPGVYGQVYNASWINNNLQRSSIIYSPFQTVMVVGNPILELNTTNVTTEINHGESYEVVILINNTGNAALLDIWANYTEITLPKEWININPNYWSSIDYGKSETFVLVISIPKGTSPGLYTGLINVTSHLGYPDERKEIIEINVTVPVDSRWTFKVFARNGTQVDEIEESYGLNEAGLLGSLTIENLGNIPLNFSFDYQALSGSNPIDSGVFDLNKVIDSEIYNPTYLFVEKQSNSTAKFYQDGFHVSVDFKLNLTISNSTANPASNFTTITWHIVDVAPYIQNLTYSKEVEIKKLNRIRAYFDDDENKLAIVYLNVTLPNSTLDSLICAQGNPLLTDGSYDCNYYPPIEGLYLANLTACDQGGKCRTLSFNFSALAKAQLQAVSDKTSVIIDGITQFVSKNFTLNISVTNLNYTVTAYSVNVSSSPPAGTSWQIYGCNLGNISANQTKYCLLNVTVPEKTRPATYSMQPSVNWTNADDSLGTNSTQVIYVQVTSTRIINITLKPDLLVVEHGSTNSTWLLINSTGNDEARNISFSCLLETSLCPYVSFNPSFIPGIQAGNYSNVSLTISLPPGFTPGNYYPTINASSIDNTFDSFTFTVNVPINSSWITSKDNVTIKAIAGQNKTISLLNISNIGNVHLNFTFKIEGNATEWLSLLENSTDLNKQTTYELKTNYTTPSYTSFWSANLTINETNYGITKIIPISFEVYTAELNITRPTKQEPYLQVLANETIEINSSLSLAGETITNQTEFEVIIDNSTCEILSYSNIDGFWLVNCSLPTLEDGRWHNLTLRAHYLVYDMWVETFEENALYYKDITKPKLISKEIPSVEYPNNVTIKLNLSDNVEIDKVLVFVKQLNDYFELTTQDNITWQYTFTNLEVNDYDLIFYVNDTTNNTLIFEDYFEVYHSRLLFGNLTNALGEGVNATFKLYRNSTQQLLQSFSSFNGYYNVTIHKRNYDFEIEAYSTIVKIYDVDTFELPNDFIKIDAIAPAETNLIKSVNGIAFNSTLTNKAQIKIYYSQDVLVTYGLTEDYLKVFVCYSWLWDQRSCASSDLWQEVQDYSINKLLNFILINVSSFSSNFTGYAAYVIAERKPPTQAELTVYDPTALNIHHGQLGTIEIVVKSTGTTDVLNAKVDCISGTVCQEFNASYLRYIGSLAPNEQRTVKINITVPLGYDAGSYYGVVRFSADNINPIDKTLQVNVLENRSWFLEKKEITKEVGIGFGELDSISFRGINNLPVEINLSYPQNLFGKENITIEKLGSKNITIYYNTTDLQPGNYNLTINLTSNGEPSFKQINISLKVVNLTLELIEPIEKIWKNVNESLAIKTRVWFEGELINSSENVSFEIYLNERKMSLKNLTYDSENQSFYLEFIIPITKVENDLRIKAFLLPFNYSSELIKQSFILVNDTISPTIEEFSPIILENESIIRIKAFDNDEVNLTSISVTYPNSTSITLNLTFNQASNYFEGRIESDVVGDYKIEILCKDRYNNSKEGIEWIRVNELIYLIGNISTQTKLEFYKPMVGYKFKEFVVNGSYNESLRAGDYDIKFKLENVEGNIREAIINKSIEQPLEIEKLPIAAIPLSLVKIKLDNLAYKINLNFKNLSLTFDFSNQVDKIKNINDIRIYKCTNYSIEERKCIGNFTVLSPKIDFLRFKASIELNESDPLIVLAEGVICGNLICEKDYGESYYNCPQDCPQEAVCGNDICEIGESPYNCPQDCGTCGNGVCDAGESYSSCPQDCPASIPSYSPPSYSPPSFPTQDIVNQILKELQKIPKEMIQVKERTIDLTLYQGETVKMPIAVKNNMDSETLIEIAAIGDIANFISFVSQKAKILPGKEHVFELVIHVDVLTAPKLYYGSLSIIAGQQKVEIPVTIRVISTKEELLDIRITTLKDEVAPGYALPVEVTLYNLGKVPRTDVDLTIDVFDLERGEVVNSVKEVLAVETSLSRIFYLKIPKDAEEKKYQVRAIAQFSYLNRSVAAQAFAYFKVKTPLLEKQLFGFPLWQIFALTSATIFASITSIAAYRKYKIEKEKKRRYHVLLEPKYLPQAGADSAFIGNLAETGNRTWIYLKDLTTHTMIAGTTGSGKTIAAMVLAEEALMHGKSVIVFDPTAQWTGFLRKCREVDMLSKYKLFGMSEKDARAFKGKIKVVENALQKVNLKEIILSKEPQIVVFVLTKLDPKDIDIFVANTINEVFKARLPESRELRCLLIYDEVHRLLPKFGGVGKGFLALERGVREFRKWGIGLVLISQVLSDFVGEIKANIGMEIQFRTRYEDDLDRISRKYGKEAEAGVIKAAVGTGMIVFSEYNRGRPYFVSFRPILHQVSRLSDEELEKYVTYDKKLEEMKFWIRVLKEKGVDTFDIETEFGLCESKLMEGAFDVVDIYLETLEPRTKTEFEKLGMKVPKYKPELIEEKEIKKAIEEAEKEREEFLKKFKEEVSIEKIKEKVKEVEKLIKEAKSKGKGTFIYEIDLERIPAEIKILEISKEVKGMQDLMFKLEKMKEELEKMVKGE